MSVLAQEKNYILQLNNITEQDLNLVGEEGLRVAILSGLNVNTPETFVVTSVAFDDFLTAGNLVNPILSALSEVIFDNWDTAVEASSKIKKLIFNATYPSLFLSPLLHAYQAMSSGREAYVKLIPSWIVTEGTVTEPVAKYIVPHVVGKESVLVAIKEAWSGLFSPEAIMDRTREKYTGPLSAAVIVQRILQAEVSGIATNVDPVTKNSNWLEVRAIYGLPSGSEQLDFNSICDVYKLDKNDLHIVEKNIVQQEKMFLLKGRPQSGDDHTMSVPISDTWRNKQKLDDKNIRKVGELAKKIGDEYTYPIEIDYSIQGSTIYITDLRELNLSESQPAPVLSENTATEPAKIELNHEVNEERKVKKEIDFQQLVKEVDSMANAMTNHTEISELPATEPLPAVTKAVDSKPTFEEYVNTPTFNLPKELSQLGLDISNATAENLSSAKSFSYLKLDITKILLRDKLIPENIVTDHTLSNQFVQLIANEIGTAAKAAINHNLVINISDFTSETYHEFEKPIGPTHADRLITNPDLLSLEYIAIKKAKRDYLLSGYYLVLPGVRHYDEIVDMKTILNQNGFRRSSLQKLGINFNLPAVELVWDEISNNDIDFIYINFAEFGRAFLQKQIFNRKDEQMLIKKINKLAELASKMKLELVVDVGTLSRIIPIITDFKVSKIITSNVPTNKEIEQISKSISEEVNHLQPKKRGRKIKDI